MAEPRTADEIREWRERASDPTQWLVTIDGQDAAWLATLDARDAEIALLRAWQARAMEEFREICDQWDVTSIWWQNQQKMVDELIGNGEDSDG